MVNSRTLKIIQRRVNTFLTETCIIERQTGTRGRMGEPLNDQWETVASDVPCRIINISQTSSSSQSAAVGSTETLIERWRLICPAGTELAVDERATLPDGRVFQIVEIDDRLTDQAFVSAQIVRARGG